MPIFPKLIRRFRAAPVFLALFLAPAAQAGMSYQMDQAHAAAGQTIQISGILFNDTGSALHSIVPERIVLHWRGEHGATLSSIAYREQGNGQVDVPVNNFVRFSWHTVVPTGARGLQAVSVQDQNAFTMALEVGETGDESGRKKGPAGATLMAQADATPSAPPFAGPAEPQGTSLVPAPVPSTNGLKAPPSAFENFRSAISSFEPIYFDVGSKGDTNARFQLSFKYRLFTPNDPRSPGFLDNLYFGYTQTSLWDLQGDSMPFVDTTYNPSFFWHKDKLWETSDSRWFTGLATGAEHKSNGKGGDDSRSLNDVFVQPELNYRFDGGSTLTFAPRLKSYFLYNQNPDYPDYLGRVDWKLRWMQDDGLVLDGLYQQGHHGRHAVQLEAAWPLQRTFLHMNGYLHVQFYQGYGETLLGYKQKTDPQVRIGLSLVP